MLIHLCILGVVYACALLPCASSIFELVAGQELCHRLSLWEQNGMLRCQTELGLGVASMAAMVPCKRKT